MKFETGISILVALGLISGSIVSELQHRRIVNLQTQVDELRIVVNQKFLPAMIFNKEDFNIR